MTQDELKLVLEALETPSPMGQYKAITAIKEALAQTQEPVAFWNFNSGFSHCMIDQLNEAAKKNPAPLYTSPPQRTEQEPVAWMRQDGQKVTTASDRHNYPDYETRYSIPLYTTPPQRSESSGKPSAWVGLTDKQTTQAIKSMPKGIKGWMIDWDLHDFSKAIEAKLKEKNT